MTSVLAECWPARKGRTKVTISATAKRNSVQLQTTTGYDLHFENERASAARTKSNRISTPTQEDPLRFNAKRSASSDCETATLAIRGVFLKGAFSQTLGRLKLDAKTRGKGPFVALESARVHRPDLVPLHGLHPGVPQYPEPMKGYLPVLRQEMHQGLIVEEHEIPDVLLAELRTIPMPMVVDELHQVWLGGRLSLEQHVGVILPGPLQQATLRLFFRTLTPKIIFRAKLSEIVSTSFNRGPSWSPAIRRTHNINN